jgi:serpin B
LCLHFRGDTSGATDLINCWVSDNTAQKITKIILPGVLNSLTRLVLVNAVYFKGDWVRKFDVADTKEENFYISSTEKVRQTDAHE